MKAVSIVKPGGSLIASGEKTIEVRRWQPDLSPTEDLLIVENEKFLHQDGDKDDNGKAVAVVRVKLVRPFVRSDIKAACATSFEEGWLAWELTDIRPVRDEFAALAARRIYEVAFPK
ncbi:MAG TPA: ASCH domain-containing protein [Beijerinckiaceae bacterium]|jgi:hypothetical protein|nr:ASCH domain-containing protein [Beijerinckiaceae bacterium]